VGFCCCCYLAKRPAWTAIAAIDTVIFSWPATVITATVVAFHDVQTAQGAFEQIDANLLQAARPLGVGSNGILWVILPLAWWVVAGTVLAFARALGEFGYPDVSWKYSGQTQTIPVAIYFAVEAGDMKQASIWVLVIWLFL